MAGYALEPAERQFLAALNDPSNMATIALTSDGRPEYSTPRTLCERRQGVQCSGIQAERDDTPRPPLNGNFGWRRACAAAVIRSFVSCATVQSSRPRGRARPACATDEPRLAVVAGTESS